MGFQTILLLAGCVVLMGFPIAAMLTGRASLVGAAFAVLLALFASGGAWYAWAESRSVPWTLGYGFFAMVCLFVAVVQLLRKKNS